MELYGKQKTSFGTKSLLATALLGSVFIAYKLFFGFGEASNFIGHTNFGHSAGVYKVSVKFQRIWPIIIIYINILRRPLLSCTEIHQQLGLLHSSNLA